LSYGIYIGRNRTADGIAYLSGYGDEPSSHWLDIVPRNCHSDGAMLTVGTTQDADLPGLLSEIPQVSNTARHLCVNYSYYKGTPAPLTNGGLNEFGVAVRDIWSPSRPELIAMTPKNQMGPNYSELARLVLDRARTAKDGVRLIGELIDKYGHTTYGGNSHLIADAEEAWVVIEFAGGLGLWAAERLGPDSIRASRPGYIEEVPFDGRQNPDFLFSKNLFTVAISNGWYDPASTAPFNVNEIYGDGKGRWPGVQWIEEELNARSLRQQKIGLEDVMWAVRTDRLTGDSAGYGQIVPLNREDHDHLRYIWHTQTAAIAAPFVPVFLGITHLAEEFRLHRYLTKGESGAFLASQNTIGSEAQSVVSQGIESTRSATQVFKRLQNLIFQQSDLFLPEVTTLWHALEKRLIEDCVKVRRIARILIEADEKELAAGTLTYFTNTELLNALEVSEKLSQSYELRTRLLFGIKTTSGPVSPERIW
jgi:dipeptidase